MNDHSLPVILQENITDQVYRLLLSKIISQEFSPGEKLSVPELADALNVSRTPVKEAINRLALEDLITVVPRKGTFVADVTPESIKDLFDVRLMMELYAADVAVKNATEKDDEEIAKLLSELEKTISGDSYHDFQQFLSLDTGFHLYFFRLAKNELLLKLFESISHRIKVVRAYQKAPGVAQEAHQTHDEHNRIVWAFIARDRDALRVALTTHFKNRQHLIMTALSSDT